MPRALGSCLGVFVLLALARPARAAPQQPRWTFTPEVTTTVPVDVGVRLTVEAPMRLRLSTELGFLPGPYVDALNAVLVGVGAYPEEAGKLIRSALSSSLVWRTHVGYRPWSSLGLYAEAGYMLVTLGGSATGAQIVEGVTGQSLPQTERGGAHDFTARSTLHLLDVEIGYELPLYRAWKLRFALGGIFTLAAGTTIKPAFAPRAPRLVDGFASYAENYLDNVYTSYVFAPVVGVGAGCSF